MKSPALLLPLTALLALSLLACTKGTSPHSQSGISAGMEAKIVAKKEMIQVEAPQPGEAVRSPLTVRGKARGPWYFEGDFPLILRDHRGEILARGIASANGEWMTDDFVPFEGRLEFVTPKQMAGDLILQKDNPSDRRELDDSLIIPVQFR